MKPTLQKCIDVIVAASEKEITPEQARSLVDRMVNEVERPTGELDNAEKRLAEIGNQIIGEDKLMSAVQRRNTLLTMFARQRIRKYTEKFSTRGEGLRAFMAGTSKKAAEGRYSVYYQGQAIKNKYAGRLIDELQRQDLMNDFKSGHLDEQIFKEMWELGRDDGTGKPGITGSPKAAAIAKIIHDINVEMIDRENRAGGFVHKLEGYIMRQAHDPDEIRRAGGLGFGEGSSQASFRVWSEFILPLLDQERTFKGAEDKIAFLRSAHEGIITGIHNRPDVDQADVNAVFKNTGSLARKVSATRVLHFKDAQAAYTYNQRFGTREFRDSVVRAISMRAQNIALMENFGPNPERTFDTLVREFKADSKGRSDDVRQLDSLNDWRLEATFRELTGQNDHSRNPSLSRIMAGIRAIQNMSKLGGATLTALADKAFLQSEMGFQGIAAMDTLAKQFSAFKPKSPEERHLINMLGAATDGFTNSVVQRFSIHDNRAGLLMKMQRKFFELNFMTAWNDIHKGAAANLMSAHLANHANLPSDKLPKELSNVLKLYGIDGDIWDAIRTTTTEVDGRKYIAPDGLLQLSDDRIRELLKARELKDTPNNMQRMRDELDTRLRTYFADRVDIAIPTPGLEERMYSHLNTQSGTPLGDAIRLLMMFKAMPITVVNKVVKREIYGNGSNSVLEWLRRDRRGNFRMIQLIALTTLGGYISGMVKDALKGREPKDLRPKNIQDAMMRGGGLGIYGDFLFNEYDRSYRSFTANAAGPVISQLDNVADMFNKLKRGENVSKEAGKLITDNTPFINLFYIRPVLDYLILWNLQEMSDPGSLRRGERRVRQQTGQGFFIQPSEEIRK